MAKVFIVLLSVLVVLNGMTFLVVVNQVTAPGQGASSADAATKKPQGPDPAIQKLESLERTVQGFKGSMDRLSSKVDGLQTKVNQVASRSAASPPPASVAQPLPPPSGGAKRPPSPIQRGRVDYSRVTNPQAGSSPAEGGEEANEEGPAPAEGTPPPPAVEGAAVENADGGVAPTAPAAEGADGTAPQEAPAAEGSEAPAQEAPGGNG